MSVFLAPIILTTSVIYCVGHNARRSGKLLALSVLRRRSVVEPFYTRSEFLEAVHFSTRSSWFESLLIVIRTRKIGRPDNSLRPWFRVPSMQP